jgi:hypothetical protein
VSQPREVKISKVFSEFLSKEFGDGNVTLNEETEEITVSPETTSCKVHCKDDLHVSFCHQTLNLIFFFFSFK